MSEENKRIVEEINTAFANGDPETFLSHCSEDVSWTMVGEKTNHGKAAIREWMASMKDLPPPKFTFNKLIADDNAVVCAGSMLMKDKTGTEQKHSFCDIYEFKGDKIVDLETFVIKHLPAGEKQKAATF
jgi:uncharacterized protein (TIGR02246 family)